MSLTLTYSIRSLWLRKSTAMLTLIGIALVTVIFLSVLMLEDGLERALVESGSPNNALVLRKGASTEIASGLTRAQAQLIRTLPHIARDAQVRPLALPEMVVLINIAKTNSDTPANVVVRGTDVSVFALRPSAQLTAGRIWQPGTTEIVLGSQIAARFLTSGMGTRLTIGKRDWVVVGIFDAGGTAFDSEIWGDADQLMATYGRESYSSLTLRLAETERLPALQQAMLTDPRLQLSVTPERDYYREKSITLATFIRLLGLTFTGIFSCAAVLAGTMTMYAAVAARTREIGILRSMGFGPAHIFRLFLSESLLYGTGAGLAALSIGWLLQFVTLSTMNFSTFSEVAFRLTLTPRAAALSVAFALLIGLLGGLPPAIRAARVPVTQALGAAGR